MLPRLERGRLIPPDSVRHGRERLRALEHEIRSIDAQLADDSRRERYASTDEWLRWRRSAESAQSLFCSERDQLREWIDTAEHPLLREAYELLKTLKEEDVDFNESELALIAKLDEHFQ